MLNAHTILDKSWIEARIPHQGTMCLLDRVVDWSKEHITCSSNSHRLVNNPLRNNERLSTACGIEYAAQAMAVHGALLAPDDQERPRAGFLISIRGTTIHRTYLDDIKQVLTINAELIHKSESNILYNFKLFEENDLLLDGRAAVMLNSESLLGNLA